MFFRAFKAVRAWEIKRNLSGPYSLAYLTFGVVTPLTVVTILATIFGDFFWSLPPEIQFLIFVGACIVTYVALLIVDCR
jgi:hypothetical protein